MYRTIKKIIAILLIIICLCTNNAVPFATAAQNVTSKELAHVKPMKLKEGLLHLSTYANAQTSAQIRQPLTVQEPEKSDYKADEDIVLTINNPDKAVFTTKVTDASGNEIPAEIRQVENDLTTDVVVIANNQFKPGKYTIEITDQEQHTTKQIFTWGVLAINTDKSIYLPQQKAAFSLAVLDENGNMVCNADLSLIITKPDGTKDTLTTKDGQITTNDECHKKEFTLKPDYEASYLVGTPGEYSIFLMAITATGTFSIEDTLSVKDDVAFDIKRTAPTRIYPPLHYPVELEITANKDFTGTITETVPDSFTITPSDEANSYDKMNTLYLNKQKDPANILGASTSNLIMPFEGDDTITQGFGMELTEPTLRNLYSRYGLGGHDGIDFALPIGTPLYAIDNGSILLAGDGDYGMTIVMQHAWGRSYYGHLSKTTVTSNKDVTVQKGTLIGYSGNTGESTGPHLHFGIKPDKPDTGNGYIGKIDPSLYLPINGTTPAKMLSLENIHAVLAASDSASSPLPLPEIQHPAETSSPTASTSAQPTEYTVKDDQLLKEMRNSESPVIEKVKVIKWEISLKQGEKTTLSYTYLAPQESPQFYVTGPLKFFDKSQAVVFQETRKWQIAADAVGDDWYDKAWEYRKEITLEADPWCNDTAGATCTTSWTARRKITINNAASGTSLTNFPILVKVDSTRIDYSKTQGSGQDLRFIDPSNPTVALNHEIESWNESGTSYVWVKVPTVDGSSSADYIWMYYNNASVGSPATQLGNDTHETGVWDSDFKGIWHLKESPNGTAGEIKDSTTTNADMTTFGSMTSGDQVAGQIGGSLDFDGSNDFAKVSNYQQYVANDTTVTLSGWVHTPADNQWNDFYFGIINQNYLGDFYVIHRFEGDRIRYQGNDGTNADVLSTQTRDAWQLVTLVSDGSILYGYKDGVLVGQTAKGNAFADNVSPFTIAADDNDDNGVGATLFTGQVDEVRVSTAARSADWIEAEYLTMNDAMNTYGSEQLYNTTLSNFPVLISLSSDANLSSLAQSDGDDILFTSNDGRTKLSHEIERYSAGTLVAWVKIPTISLSQDTKIFMYYGNTGTGSQEDATNVWDSNYKGIWHMNENPAGTAPQILDSTATPSDGTSGGTMTSGDLVTGKVTSGIDFDGSDDVLNMGSATKLDDLTAITVSGWMYARTQGESLLGRIMTKTVDTAGTNGWQFYLDDGTSGGLDFDVGYSTTYLGRFSNVGFTYNAWHYVTMTWDGSTTASNVKIYVNGAELAYLGTANGSGSRQTDAAQNLLIGNGVGSTRTFNGILDEMHVSNSVRSTDWIATEYRNQNSPSTFHTLGSQETYIFAPTLNEAMRHGKFFDSRGSKQPFAF